MTDTAQVIGAVAVAATSPSWWHVLGGFIAGILTAKKAPDKVAATEAAIKAIAPDAATIATLAGQPALAGGIEMASKIVDSMNNTQNPAQLAALVAAHSQALAAAGAPKP